MSKSCVWCEAAAALEGQHLKALYIISFLPHYSHSFANNAKSSSFDCNTLLTQTNKYV